MMLKNSFGCFSLHGGTTFIGLMSLASTILSAISSICSYIRILDMEQGISKNDQAIWDMLSSYVVTCALVLCVSIAFMAGLMVYGAQKRKPEYVFPWLAFDTTCLVTYASLGFSAIIIIPTIIPIDSFLIALVVFLLGFAVHLYVWLIVFSCYKQLLSEKYGVETPSNAGQVFEQPLNIYHKI